MTTANHRHARADRDKRIRRVGSLVAATGLLVLSFGSGTALAADPPPPTVTTAPPGSTEVVVPQGPAAVEDPAVEDEPAGCMPRGDLIDIEDPADSEPSAHCARAVSDAPAHTLGAGEVHHNGPRTGEVHGATTKGRATPATTLPATDTVSGAGSTNHVDGLAVPPFGYLLAAIASLLAGAITWIRQPRRELVRSILDRP